MSKKALLNTVLFVFILVLMIWIPRFIFQCFIQNEASPGDLFNLNYLYISLLFDLKTISYWFIPLFLILLTSLFVQGNFLKRARYITAFLLIILFLTYSFIAIFYYPVSKSIVGKELFNLLSGQSYKLILNYVREYWWAVFLIVLLSYFFTEILMRLKFKLNPRGKIPYLLLILATWFLAARGSLSLKPLNPLDAYAALKPELAVSAMTPPYILLESLFKENIEEYPYLNSKDLTEYQRKDYKYYAADTLLRPNICILILESFAREYTGLNPYTNVSYTPFLDSLMLQGRYCTNAYSNGLRSMDAVAAIFGGIPALLNEPLIGSRYGNQNIKSLYHYMHEMGYFCSFYHGADEHSMGFKPYLQAQGLDFYGSMKSYLGTEGYDDAWGIYDKAFLDYFLSDLDHHKQPWCSSVFTLSSHHPYSVPEGEKDLKKGTLPIHQSVAYTDDALRIFFQNVKTKPWFYNTLFIITADHTSLSEFPEYMSSNGKYTVPLLFYAPTFIRPEPYDSISGHIDIIPTILDICAYPDTFFSLGHSVFRASDPYVVHFEGGRYVITMASYSLEMTATKAIALYHNEKDPRHKKNLIRLEKEIATEMEDLLKKYIQNFNHRILTNTYR